MRKSMKITAALGGGAIVLATAGVAYAYWSTTGTGSGTATAGTSTADTITLTGANPTGILLGQTVNIDVTAQNTASYSQSAGVVSGTPTFPLDCDGDNWTYTPGSSSVGVLTANDSAAGGTDQKVLTVGTLKLLDRTDTDQQGCKNAVVSFSFSAPAS